MTTDLTFCDQIDMVVESASRMAGCSLRTFRSGRGLLLTLLHSLIQPRLDYCSQLWSPRDQVSINRLEVVQRQFSQIRNFSLLDKKYWEKLSIRKVYSQERRCERYQGLVDGYTVNWQWNQRRGRMAIPNNIPLQARERSLGVHGARLFNILLVNLRNEN